MDALKAMEFSHETGKMSTDCVHMINETQLQKQLSTKMESLFKRKVHYQSLKKGLQGCA